MSYSWNWRLGSKSSPPPKSLLDFWRNSSTSTFFSLSASSYHFFIFSLRNLKRSWCEWLASGLASLYSFHSFSTLAFKSSPPSLAKACQGCRDRELLFSFRVFRVPDPEEDPRLLL